MNRSLFQSAREKKHHTLQSANKQHVISFRDPCDFSFGFRSIVISSVLDNRSINA